ncbi:MAG: spore protease YyaC [Lachnospiraceae bacterium]|nr:spore protease YyaC [Lachnospiraceae bacterium]
MNRQIYYHKAGKWFSPELFGGQFKKLVAEVRKSTKKEGVLFLCIGSDRSTGDSLGPLVGYKLQRTKGEEYRVFGTLMQPIHAINLKETMEMIGQYYRDYVVVAVDASVGRYEHVGYITLGRGAIRPGLGVSKNLISVGDIFITGIVGYGGNFEPLLQNTRLSVVMELADCICAGIGCVGSSAAERDVDYGNTQKYQADWGY